MKFSNFVSTLAVVCLAFNTDALRIETNMSKQEQAQLDFLNYAPTKQPYAGYSKVRAHEACKVGIDDLIKTQWSYAKKSGVTLEHLYGLKRRRDKKELPIYDRIFARLNNLEKDEGKGETKTQIESMFDDDDLLSGCLLAGNGLYTKLSFYNNLDDSEANSWKEDMELILERIGTPKVPFDDYWKP